MQRWPPSWPATPVNCCSRYGRSRLLRPDDLGDEGDKSEHADPGWFGARTSTDGVLSEEAVDDLSRVYDRCGSSTRWTEPGSSPPAAGTTGPCTSRCGSAPEPLGRRHRAQQDPTVASPTRRSHYPPWARCTAPTPSARLHHAPKARSGSPPAPAVRLRCCGGCATRWTSSFQVDRRQVPRRWPVVNGDPTPICGCRRAVGVGFGAPPRDGAGRRAARFEAGWLAADLQPP